MFSRFKQNFCPKKKRAQEKEKFRCFTMLNVDRKCLFKTKFSDKEGSEKEASAKEEFYRRRKFLGFCIC